DVVTHTGQILHPAATHQNHRVFLEVVAFTADVRNDFVAVGEAHLGDLTQGRVRLLGGGGVDASANAATLRAIFERRALAGELAAFARLAHELADSWHAGILCWTNTAPTWLGYGTALGFQIPKSDCAV